jgi:uncharacterized protein with ParB-like and HNH nuclease domain
MSLVELNSNAVRTVVQTPETIFSEKIAFEIPVYQRAYVWGGEGVLKLLQDIEQAYLAYEPQYYIGTVLTATLSKQSNHDAQTSFELIDGQQRMTTLMLIAIAFNNADIECVFAKVATLCHLPRVTFLIREAVQGLLCSWCDLEFTHKPSDDQIHKNEYTKHLAEALKTASSFIEEIRKDINKGESYLVNFANYLFSNVRWVNNIIPTGTDLNKLFSTMNTSGIQLEQSDILKSKLLGKLKLTKHLKEYDALWQVCENLNNYIERNARKVFTASNWSVIKDEELAEFDLALLKLVDEKAIKAKGLKLTEIINSTEILQQETTEAKKTSDKNNGEEDDDSNDAKYCRSIISFPLLLIHAFRIYKASSNDKVDIDSRVNGEKLNTAFDAFIKNADEEAVKDFLHCLWAVRYQFDKWVVKWVKKPEESTESLRLSTVRFNKNRLNRNADEISALSQLQSVRNFTGERSAQHWLTALLGSLVNEQVVNQRILNKIYVIKLLEDIDNKMSLALFNAKLSQKEANFAYLIDEGSYFGDVDNISHYLQQAKGTGFEHYWFQKLEYILWKQVDSSKSGLSAKDLDKFNKYRITSKNSVEHVHPQHEEYNQKLSDEILNAFGNLVLLSPGENSSYSNQTVGKKYEDFKDKPVYDALKLKSIFELKADSNWDEGKIKQHQQEMIELMVNHYSKVNNGVLNG